LHKGYLALGRKVLRSKMMVNLKLIETKKRGMDHCIFRIPDFTPDRLFLLKTLVRASNERFRKYVKFSAARLFQILKIKKNKKEL
jgi:hypothetical protein